MALDDQEDQSRYRKHGRLFALAILVGGLIFGIAAAAYAHSNLQAAERRRLEEQAEHVAEAIDKRMSAYEAMLLSTRALFAASRDVTRDEFGRFVTSLELPTRYPGILGLGYTAKLHGTREERWSTVQRALGEYPMPFWPSAEAPPPESAVIFLEPRSPRNQAALGFDLYAYPTRREAMVRAASTGSPAISHRVPLIQELSGNEQPGFLFFVPVYQDGTAMESVQEGPNALAGWVYGAFRMGNLLHGILGPRPLPFHLRIYDGPEVGPDRLFFEQEGASTAPEALVVQRSLTRAGTTWTLVMEGPDAGPIGVWLPGAILLGSILVSLLLSAVTWLQVRQREAAEDSREVLVRNDAERLRLLAQEKAAREEADRARIAAKFLADASTLVNSAPASPTLLEELARRAVPYLGDGCTIDLFGPDERLWREVLITDDPKVNESLKGVYRGRPLDRRLAPSIFDAVEGGGPVIHERPAQALLDTFPPPMAEIANHLGSYLLAPIAARGRTFGVIGFYSKTAGRYGVSDQALVEDFAQRIALAIDNARLFIGAQDAIRVRDDFLSIASHELRTPLTALQAQLQGLRRQVAREDGLPAERLLERLETALRQTFRLGRLVRDLLDFTLLTEGRIPLEREEFDLSDLVREVVERFEGEASRAGSTIHVDAAEGTTGCWDRQRLEQVVGGLLSNAIKYGAGGAISITVGVEGPLALLEVQDRGIGIAPEAQRRIFDRYERAASLRNYGGLGLGLFIACQITAAHDGEIEVNSEPGAGSTFRARLPRMPPSANPPDSGVRQEGAQG